MEILGILNLLAKLEIVSSILLMNNIIRNSNRETILVKHRATKGTARYPQNVI